MDVDKDKGLLSTETGTGESAEMLPRQENSHKHKYEHLYN